MFRRELCAVAGVAAVSGCLRLQDDEAEGTEGVEASEDDGSTPGDDDGSDALPEEPPVHIEEAWTAPDRGTSLHVTEQRVFLAGQNTSRTTADGDRITVGGVAAIDLDGAVEWRRYEERTFAEASIRRHNGSIYAGESGIEPGSTGQNGDPRIVVSLTDDGTERWRFEADNPIWTLSSIRSDVVVVGTARLDPDGIGTGWIYALDRETGQRRWEERVEEEYPRYIDVDGRTAYAALWNGIRAYDIETGDERWRVDARPNDLQAVDGMVYTSYNDEVRAHASTDGERILAGEMFGNLSTALVIDDNAVFAGSADTGVYAFDAETGEQYWRHRTDGGIVGLSYDGERVWATTDADTAVALSREGEPLFRAEIDGDISVNTHATVGDNLVVTGVRGTVGYRIVER